MAYICTCLKTANISQMNSCLYSVTHNLPIYRQTDIYYTFLGYFAHTKKKVRIFEIKAVVNDF